MKILKLISMAFLVVSTTLATTACATEQLPALIFRLNDDQLKQYSLPQLREQVSVEQIEIFDPEYGAIKHYHALPFLPVLQKVYGLELDTLQWNAVSFTAVDGYEATIDLDKFSHDRGAYLVFEDLDNSDWQDLPGHSDTRPGPFYLVWYDKAKTTKRGYHYPWQIQAIALVSRADRYASVKPEIAIGESADSIAAGYELFKTRCQSCHAISGQGGKLGPDLNAPQNILSYRSENMVRAFIKAPSQFRHSRMPDFTDLSAQKIDQLIDYMWQLNRQSRAY